MNITWVTRSFLDYRIPVFQELDKLCENNLHVVFYKDVVPERVQEKIRNVLGERAIPMTGELRFTGEKNAPLSDVKKRRLRIPYQPRLIRTIKTTSPDVMVSDGFFQWTYASLWLRMTRKIPHVMCYEPTKHTERNVKRYRLIYRKLAMKLIDAICCNGKLCREYIISMGYCKNRIFTGQMAADTERLATTAKTISSTEISELKKRYNISGTVFIYVGRLVRLKGIMELLAAWQSVKLSNVTLLLVGDGEQREELESFCAENHLENVIFVGNVNYDEIAMFYRCSDVFIIPTLQDNWSLVVPEAMACGLPIACSKYNGCYPELVKPENGWVFDPLSCEDTVQMLQQIISKKTLLPEMGIRSKQIISQHSPKHAAECIFDACNHVL